MAIRCHVDQYWDALIKKCFHCHLECQRPVIIPRCLRYCETANCKALPGHYYDGLLKKCVRCADICGRHPADCSKHCQTTLPPVMTRTLPADVPSYVPTAPGDSTILLYPLLAFSIVLLFSSLSLALVVLLRGARAKTSKPGLKEPNHNQEHVVQQAANSGSQSRQSSKDSVTNSNHRADREPLDDSIPTETCVCVHCFPDLKALGHGSERPLRPPFSLYPQAVLHRDQIQKGGSLWSEGNMYNSVREVQEEAAVG